MMKVQPRIAPAPSKTPDAAPVKAAALKPATKPAAPAPLDEATARSKVEAFFKAFENHDRQGLEAAYAPNAKFHDDMFTLTKRSSILEMWKGAPPFKTFKAEILDVKGNEVHAKWVAEYKIFGRDVHNEIDSHLTLDGEGRITSQQEDWDEKKWMSQALPVIPRFLQGAAYFVMRPLLSMKMGG